MLLQLRLPGCICPAVIALPQLPCCKCSCCDYPAANAPAVIALLRLQCCICSVTTTLLQLQRCDGLAVIILLRLLCCPAAMAPINGHPFWEGVSSRGRSICVATPPWVYPCYGLPLHGSTPPPCMLPPCCSIYACRVSHSIVSICLPACLQLSCRRLVNL